MAPTPQPSSTLAQTIALVWFCIDAVTHLGVELSYLVLALGPTAAKSDSVFAEMWKEYGKADARWAVRDVDVISIELAVVFLMGPMAVACAYGVAKRRPWRHVLTVILCTMELFGGWFTFGPEWLNGSPNLNTANPIYLWIYLVFMNGLWVLVPAVLLWESFMKITQACDQAKTEVKTTNELPRSVWVSVAVSMVAYSILVPGSMWYAKQQ